MTTERIYDRPHMVVLTVSEWLSMRSALSDARRYNADHNFHYIAGEIKELHDKLKVQTDPILEAADAQNAVAQAIERAA